MYDIFKEPPTLESERIKLIPMEYEHSLSLFQINQPDIWAFMLSEIKTKQGAVQLFVK